MFKINYSDFKYDINDKLSISYKTNNNYILDNINFPTIDKYHLELNKLIEKYIIKYKNSTINIEFIEINNNTLSIKFIFNLHEKNFENFKNISFLIKKLFHNFN